MFLLESLHYPAVDEVASLKKFRGPGDAAVQEACLAALQALLESATSELCQSATHLRDKHYKLSQNAERLTRNLMPAEMLSARIIAWHSSTFDVFLTFVELSLRYSHNI